MLIDVTIDIRDLDPTGPTPAHASVTFARIIPAVTGSTITTTTPVKTTLTGGHGTVQLTAGTAYLIRCYGIGGIRAPFAILAPAAATSLGILWRDAQIDPDTVLPLPAVPSSVQELLDRAEALLQQATVGALTAAADADDPQLVDLTFPVEQLDSADACLLDLTVGT